MVDAIGPLLSGIFAVLFDRIAKRKLLDFFIDNAIDEQLLRRLKILLLPANEVLEDAEEKEMIDPSMKQWVDNLKEAVFDVDDLFDEIFIRQSQSSMLEDLNPFREGVKDKVEKIIYTLEKITEQREMIGGIKSVKKKLPSLFVSTFSSCDEPEMYGREEDKRKIIEFMLSSNVGEEKQVPVVAIVGVAGIGKTALTKLVYNDEEMRRHFSLRLWISVSDGMNVFAITKKICECVTVSHCDLTDLNLLQFKVKAIMEDKRFLVVLDDLSSNQFLDWNVLKILFSGGVTGSRVIVTSRRSTVASDIGTSLTHLISYLSHQDCWMIFKNYAFTHGAVSPVLERIGKEIVRKCHGLPILAKVLGRRFSSVEDVEKWDHASNSNMWDLASDSISLLRLGYIHLPYHLKRCFSFCSIFPHGHEIEKSVLVSLWMAEGLLPLQKNTERTENVGNKYIMELMSMSYLQVGKKESYVVMPDIVHDLAKHFAGEFTWTQVDVDNNQEPTEKIRYLSYNQKELSHSDQLVVFKDLSQLRTLLPFKVSENGGGKLSLNVIVDMLLPNMKRLRTLSLTGYPLERLPDIVVNLQHLRYLDLSSTTISQLPHSIVSLYNLETLLLFDCKLLSDLPSEVCDLVNLRHLDIRGTGLSEMPSGFDRLEALEVLTNFFVTRNRESCGSNIGDLGKLSKLNGSLSIMNLEDVTLPCDANAANLKNKKHLVSLEFKWTAVNQGTMNEMVAEQQVLIMLRPYEYLKRLVIENFGGLEFPIWLRDSQLSNLACLYLTGCGNCMSLPCLGNLPSLSELYLTNLTALETVGLEFYGSEVRPFMSLTILKFHNMQKWKKWSSNQVGCGEFPSLVQLTLESCPLLEGELPRVINPSAKVVVLHCQKLKD